MVWVVLGAGLSPRSLEVPPERVLWLPSLPWVQPQLNE